MTPHLRHVELMHDVVIVDGKLDFQHSLDWKAAPTQRRGAAAFAFAFATAIAALAAAAATRSLLQAHLKVSHVHHLSGVKHGKPSAVRGAQRSLRPNVRHHHHRHLREGRRIGASSW